MSEPNTRVPLLSSRPPLSALVVLSPLLWLLPLFAALPLLDSHRLLWVGEGWLEVSAKFHMHSRAREVLASVQDLASAHREPELPLFRLRLSPRSIASLTADLPRSGFLEHAGALELDEELRAVRLRLRGDNSYHWFFPKRSWRLTTRKEQPLALGRRLHLLNPKGPPGVWIAVSALARELDVIHSPAKLALVELNGRYQGLYVCLPELDESVLRRLGRMPGDMWVADYSRRGNPFKFVVRDTQPHLWREVASSGRASPPGPSSLERLLEGVNTGSYWSAPRSGARFDEEVMARFCAFVTLLGTTQIDSAHNLVLFQDALTGRFEFGEWDAGGLSGGTSDSLDTASNRLFTALLLNPLFVARKDAVLQAGLADRALIDRVDAEVRRVSVAAAPWAARDALEELDLDAGFDRQGAESFEVGVRDLSVYLVRRRQQVLRQLDRAAVAWCAESGRVALVASEVAPSTRPRLTFALPVSDRLRVLQDRDMNGHLSAGDVQVNWSRTGDREVELDDTLYPGRADAGSAIHLSPAPLGYLYHLVDPDGPAPLVVGVSATNALTGSAAAVTTADSWVVRACDSLHPWSLPPDPAPLSRTVSGEVRPEGDWRIEAHETVTIAPGTRIALGPGASILCYGRLLARGTVEAPIRIERAEPGRPWGVVALNGAGAGGSRLEHVVFDGGGAAHLDDVDYLGMVNVHLAPDVELRGCTLRRNTQSDALLRLADCDARVIDCTFEQARGDGLDGDYFRGEVSGCRFVDCGKDGIDLMSSDALVRSCVIDGAGDTGISVGEGSTPIVFDVQITRAAIGIEVKDGSDPLIAHCRVQAELALNGYAENWRYADGGHGRLFHCDLQGTRGVVLDERSDLQLTGCRLQAGGEVAVTGRAALQGCQLDASAPDALRAEPLLWRVLGLAGPLPLGRLAERLTPRPMPVRYAARFTDDLTLGVRGWTPSPPEALVKENDGLRLERRLGRDVTLTWAPEASVGTGATIVALELRAEPPVEATLLLEGPAGVREVRLGLGRDFARPWQELPPGGLDRAVLRLPPGRGKAVLRRVELR